MIEIYLFTARLAGEYAVSVTVARGYARREHSIKSGGVRICCILLKRE